jgi:hypothetical protein
MTKANRLADTAALFQALGEAGGTKSMRRRHEPAFIIESRLDPAAAPAACASLGAWRRSGRAASCATKSAIVHRIAQETVVAWG